MVTMLHNDGKRYRPIGLTGYRLIIGAEKAKAMVFGTKIFRRRLLYKQTGATENGGPENGGLICFHIACAYAIMTLCSRPIYNYYII